MSTPAQRAPRVRHGAWIAAALVVSFAIVLFLRGRERTDSAPSVPVPGVEAPRAEAEGPGNVVSAGEGGGDTAPTVVSCTGQQIDLTLDGKTNTICVGTVDTNQSGSVRTYSVESTSMPARWLRIDVADRAILSAALGSGRVTDFQCKGQGCSGISLGKRDIEGARIISISRAALKRMQPDGAESSDAAALISGKLKTVPEHQVPGLACTAGEGSVSVVTSEGSSHSFCAKGGAGFEGGNDGNRTYRFTSLDSDSILILVDPARQVKQVEFQGDATLSCAGPSCGVRLSGPNGAGERTFTFAGTTLVEKSAGQMSAVLNGALTVPPLE
jgi:hypothetical protein